MDVSDITKDFLENLKKLMNVPFAILLLAFLSGANVVLNRNFGLSLLQVTKDFLSAQVSIGASLLFLCLMIFYMTSVANVMRWLFVNFFIDLILKAHDGYQKFFDRSIAHRPVAGDVFKGDILKRANMDANPYYLDIYNKHEEERLSAEDAAWNLSSHALACLVLLGIDIRWDGKQSIPVFVYSSIQDKLNTSIAVLLVGIIGLLLLGAVIAPIIRDSSLWIYCPGFPKDDDKNKNHSSDI